MLFCFFFSSRKEDEKRTKTKIKEKTVNTKYKHALKNSLDVYVGQKDPLNELFPLNLINIECDDLARNVKAVPRKCLYTGLCESKNRMEKERWKKKSNKVHSAMNYCLLDMNNEIVVIKCNVFDKFHFLE